MKGRKYDKEGEVSRTMAVMRLHPAIKADQMIT